MDSSCVSFFTADLLPVVFKHLFDFSYLLIFCMHVTLLQNSLVDIVSHVANHSLYISLLLVLLPVRSTPGRQYNGVNTLIKLKFSIDCFIGPHFL